MYINTKDLKYSIYIRKIFKYILYIYVITINKMTSRIKEVVDEISLSLDNFDKEKNYTPLDLFDITEDCIKTLNKLLDEFRKEIKIKKNKERLEYSKQRSDLRIK